jgi:single-stranded-DNA-specific exonuclease
VHEIVLKTVNGNNLLAGALVRRGLTDPQAISAFLNPKYYKPFSPDQVPEIASASERILKGIINHDPILVWGDFDVDGQTSTTILVSTLRKLGANVSYHIPIRANESHGINPDILRQYISDGVKLLITCDTGISANPAVDLARDQGLVVIITDHHQLPAILPNADYIINPQTWPQDHPLQTVSGAGVAFILARCILEKSNQSDFIKALYDLVALGLIADLANLKKDARYFVQLGLAELRNPQRPAIQKLLKLAEIDPDFLNEEHISFALAPRLNAIGRLGDANPVVEFFLSDDEVFLNEFSRKLEILNGERKLLCSHVFQAAMAQIESSRTLESDSILILSAPSWPAGVLGIVASRIVELFYRPVIIVTVNENGLAMGSARSIEGFDITSAIAEGKDLLLNFGGHPMAAGLSMKEKNLAEFRRRMNRIAANRLSAMTNIEALQIDDYLQFDEINLEIVQEIEQLAPFGPGNPALVFASRNLVVEKITAIGKGKEHLMVAVRDEHQNTKNVIWWQGVGNPVPDSETHIDLAFKLRSSNFRGKPDVQMEWVDWRLTELPNVPMQPSIQFEIIDHRGDSDELPQLMQFAKEPDCLIWSEGVSIPEVTVVDRLHFQKTNTLVLATIPPGRSELQHAIKIVQPQKVIIFLIQPEKLGAQDILAQIAGMWKYAIRQNDYENIIERMAARLNTRVVLIELCLKYLLASKKINIPENAEEYLPNLKLIKSDRPYELLLGIQNLIKEISEFREYYMRAAPAELI